MVHTKKRVRKFQFKKNKRSQTFPEDSTQISWQQHECQCELPDFSNVETPKNDISTNANAKVTNYHKNCLPEPRFKPYRSKYSKIVVKSSASIANASTPPNTPRTPRRKSVWSYWKCSTANSDSLLESNRCLPSEHRRCRIDELAEPKVRRPKHVYVKRYDSGEYMDQLRASQSVCSQKRRFNRERLEELAAPQRRFSRYNKRRSTDTQHPVRARAGQVASDTSLCRCLESSELNVLAAPAIDFEDNYSEDGDFDERSKKRPIDESLMRFLAEPKVHNFRDICAMQQHVDDKFRRHLALVAKVDRAAMDREDRRYTEHEERPTVAMNRRKKVIMTISRSLDPISECRLRAYDQIPHHKKPDGWLFFNVKRNNTSRTSNVNALFKPIT